MNDESQTEKPAFTVAMSNRDLVSILVLGGIIGLFIFGLSLVLNRYVFDVLLCQNGANNQCTYAVNYAEAAALVAGNILGLIGLIRLRVYRPLLVVLATSISLWGLVEMALGMQWYWGALVAIAMYLLAYGTYSWVARMRLFMLALAATIVLVVGVRLAVML